MADYKTTNVVFTDKDYDKKKNLFKKKKVETNYYEFDSVELKIYPKPEVTNDSVRIGVLSIPGQEPYTIRENSGEYGTYWSGTIEKGQLYFNVKKGLARKGQASPFTVTFREVVLDDEEPTDAEKVLDGEEEKDSDLPF